MTDHQQQVRDEFFGEMSDFDFNLLWRLGVERTHYKAAIIEQGEAPHSVMLVLDGGIGQRHPLTVEAVQ